ncbi:hypothetical protein [Chitinophaga caseinilytica]|uniref:hypothetical protein n=1 Tax=Chitinophaga caseinilytica TaxID=2267521 RepID=UPI003C2E2F63
MKVNKEVEVLSAINTVTPATRRQLMPGWFLIINVIIILSGIHGIFTIIQQSIIYHDQDMDPILRYLPDDWLYYVVFQQAFHILAIIPACLFFVFQKSATRWGMATGALLVIAMLFNIIGGFGVYELFTIFIMIFWALAVSAWLIHVFRIHKSWRNGRPGAWK